MFMDEFKNKSNVVYIVAKLAFKNPEDSVTS